VRAVIQRVSEADVQVDHHVVGKIGHGLLVLLSVGVDDGAEDAQTMVKKIVGLRCFNDQEGKFNLSLLDVEGAVLLVSQFTLHGDCRRGRRPSFTEAAPPEKAVPLYEQVADLLRHAGVTVATGRFGAHMRVHLVNDGPVTLLIDTKKEF
jgi:D-tyrosyl-tRNA(Tyr) deacylase